MEWINLKGCMPGWNYKWVAVKGQFIAPFKDEYKYTGHKNPIRILLPFLALIKIENYLIKENKFFVTYKDEQHIDFFCKAPCLGSDKGSHCEFMEKLGITEENITDFLEPNSLVISWNNISHWIKD